MNKAIQIAYDGFFDLKCKCAAEGGFTEIAVSFCDFPSGFGATEDDWKEVTEHVQKNMEENHLKCVQTHPYMYDLDLSSEIIYEEKEFEINQAIKLSGKVGAGWCAIHPRSSISSGFRRTVSLEDNRRVITKYLDTAIKYNTGIGVENLPIFRDRIPIMPYYGWNIEELGELSDSFADEHVGICWDTGHANVLGFDQADAIRYLGDRIRCTHIHNNYFKDDSHIPPDTGRIDWASVMKAIALYTKTENLTLETHCGYNDPQLLVSFARHNLEGLKFLERSMVISEEK